MKCANCDDSHLAYLSMTAVGQRAFCSEECYCMYVGVPYHGENYYGLERFNFKNVERLE